MRDVDRGDEVASRPLGEEPDRLVGARRRAEPDVREPEGARDAPGVLLEQEPGVLSGVRLDLRVRVEEVVVERRPGSRSGSEAGGRAPRRRPRDGRRPRSRTRAGTRRRRPATRACAAFAYGALEGLVIRTFPAWKYCCAGPTIAGVTLMDGPSSQSRGVSSPDPSFPRMKSMTRSGVIPQAAAKGVDGPGIGPDDARSGRRVAGSHV